MTAQPTLIESIAQAAARAREAKRQERYWRRVAQEEAARRDRLTAEAERHGLKVIRDEA